MSDHDTPGSSRKPVTIALGTALAGGLVLAGTAFAMNPLAQGYMAAATAGDKAAEGKCGGKHAEGKCGMDKMDADKDGRISRAEFAAAHAGKEDRFASHDPDGDGYISAAEMKAHMEGKCGEGKCGASGKKAAADKKADTQAGKKAGMEGKCGEGKCGGGI